MRFSVDVDVFEKAITQLVADISMLQALTSIIALAIMVTNILVDLSYARLDPRIRYE